jgi:hypothetical protein
MKRLLRTVAFLGVISAMSASATTTPIGPEQLKTTIADNQWARITPNTSYREVPRKYLPATGPELQSTPLSGTYSGIHIDDEGNVFYGTRGGHLSYYGNDVEMFDAASNVWIQSYSPEVCPTTDTRCAPLYSYGATDAVSPLGRPYAEHTFDYFKWHPVERRFWGILRSGTWTYDPVTTAWTRRTAPWTAGVGTWALLAYDPELGTFPAIVTQAYDKTPRAAFAWQNGDWHKRADLPSLMGAFIYSTYIPSIGKHLLKAEPAVNGTSTWWYYDAVANVFTHLAGVPVDAEQIDSFDFDSTNGVVVGIVHPNSTTFRMWIFAPQTGVWTAITPGGTLPYTPFGSSAGGNLLRYDASRNLFYFMRVLTFPSGGGGATELWTYRYRGTVPTSTPTSVTSDADFAARCASPGVARCFAFDSAAQIAGGFVRPGTSTTPVIDATVKASGTGALKFTVPGNSGPNSAGTFLMNFSPGTKNTIHTGGDGISYPVQFGVGEEFYVQWRQRFSPEMLQRMGGGGWKSVILGEGDRPDFLASSCTDLEVVMNNGGYRGLPQMYHSCGAKDGKYEGLQEGYGTYDYLLQNAIRNPACLYSKSMTTPSTAIPPCLPFKANQWMTFQIRVKVGTPYTNNKVYKHDSIVQMWVAEEGKPSVLGIDFSPHSPTCTALQTSIPRNCQTGYDLYNNNPTLRKYGKVWLLPYDTGKQTTFAHPTAYTWYDELIVSRQRIPDPR